MYEDWDLIESSFATQYNIRLRNENDMTWGEFKTLLAGIMPKTPLGQIVQIRSEEDKDVLKSFTPEQHKIRNDWRMKLMERQYQEYENISEEEKLKQIKIVQDMFAKAFGKN